MLARHGDVEGCGRQKAIIKYTLECCRTGAPLVLASDHSYPLRHLRLQVDAGDLSLPSGLAGPLKPYPLYM